LELSLEPLQWEGSINRYMSRCFAVSLSALLLAQSGVARQIKVICGTNPSVERRIAPASQAALARRAAQLQANGAQGGAQRSTGATSAM